LPAAPPRPVGAINAAAGPCGKGGPPSDGDRRVRPAPRALTLASRRDCVAS